MENIKKITLDELYLEYNKRSSNAAKESYLKNAIKIKPYISYVEKDMMAKNIIDVAHYSIPQDVNIGNMTDDELLKIKQVPVINRSAQYTLTALTLVKMYTNIDIDFKQGAFQYDKLAETGIINYILENIETSEIEEFKMLINYKYEDFYQKHFSIQSYLDKRINEFLSMTDVFVTMASDLMKNIDKSEMLNDANNIIDKIKK
jgi:hypothetical protein